jgi:hypothetical protein
MSRRCSLLQRPIRQRPAAQPSDIQEPHPYTHAHIHKVAVHPDNAVSCRGPLAYWSAAWHTGRYKSSPVHTATLSTTLTAHLCLRGAIQEVDHTPAVCTSLSRSDKRAAFRFLNQPFALASDSRAATGAGMGGKEGDSPMREKRSPSVRPPCTCFVRKPTCVEQPAGYRLHQLQNGHVSCLQHL